MKRTAALADAAAAEAAAACLRAQHVSAALYTVPSRHAAMSGSAAGCDELQGYLFGRSLSVDQLQEMFAPVHAARSSM